MDNSVAAFLEPKTSWDANRHIDCACGGKYTLKNKANHLKKTIHLRWLQGNLMLKEWALFASDYIVPEELLKRYEKFYEHGNCDEESLIGDFEEMLIDAGNVVDNKALLKKGAALQKIGLNAFKIKNYFQSGCPIIAWSLLGFPEQLEFFKEYASNAANIKKISLFEDIESFLKEMYPNIDFE